jgi:hypothetical protein
MTLCPVCAQADHKQLGSTGVPSKLLPPDWRRYAGVTGRVTVPLDGGSMHHFLCAVDNEEARKQVRGARPLLSNTRSFGVVGVATAPLLACALLHSQLPRRLRVCVSLPRCVRVLLQVYLAGAAAPAANLALLDDMLACRQSLAQLLGYPSYAAFKAADSTLAGR